jgi:hypothetical protein
MDTTNNPNSKWLDENYRITKTRIEWPIGPTDFPGINLDPNLDWQIRKVKDTFVLTATPKKHN